MEPENSSLSVSPALIPAVMEAASEERRPPAEIVDEAVTGWLRKRRWQKLFAFGEQRAKELGLTDADIPRLIAEDRQERRTGI